jgi:hypothetical protein
MNIILRSFILPKIRGSTGKGWYQSLEWKKYQSPPI